MTLIEYIEQLSSTQPAPPEALTEIGYPGRMEAVRHFYNGALKGDWRRRLQALLAAGLGLFSEISLAGSTVRETLSLAEDLSALKAEGKRLSAVLPEGYCRELFIHALTAVAEQNDFMLSFCLDSTAAVAALAGNTGRDIESTEKLLTKGVAQFTPVALGLLLEFWDDTATDILKSCSHSELSPLKLHDFGIAQLTCVERQDAVHSVGLRNNNSLVVFGRREEHRGWYELLISSAADTDGRPTPQLTLTLEWESCPMARGQLVSVLIMPQVISMRAL